MVREIGPLIGAGAPVAGIESETAVEGFEDLNDLSPENPDLEDTLIGMAWSQISGDDDEIEDTQ